MAYEPEGCLTSIVIQLGITLLGLFALLVLYGVVLLVFRHAYGVELPNPFNLFPSGMLHGWGFR